MMTRLTHFLPPVRLVAVRTLLLALVAVSLGIASCSDVPGAGRVVVTVNSKPITYGDLMRELRARHGPGVLLDLVDEALVRQEARRRNLTLTAQEREAGLARAAARVGSMADLEFKLKQAGIPLEAYRAGIDTDLLLDKIALQEVKVTEAEVAAYYREHLNTFQRGPRVRARMMFFRDKTSAENILGVLHMPGADFAGLARELSEDEVTKPKGGDMGFFERGDYAGAISDAAFSLKPGEISGVIQSPDGYVILRVEDTRPAGPLTLEEVRRDLYVRLQGEKLQPARSDWLLKARKAAPMEIPDKTLREALKARLSHPKPIPVPGEL